MHGAGTGVSEGGEEESEGSNMSQTTYLLPIWVNITHEAHEAIMKSLNDDLKKFFEEQCDQICSTKRCAIDVQWAITKHVNLQ